MIQRQQTLWLLLATAAAVLMFKFPFVTGEELIIDSDMKRSIEFTAGERFYSIILTIASVLISTITIFLFKNRKLQKRLCLLGFLVAAADLAYFIIETRKLLSFVPALWVVLPVIIILSYILAYRNIRQDQRLVKSMDKLR